MVLPGIQALFGFQLIAVFNTTFSEKLTHIQQKLHLGAIGLILISIALVMTPAAYHRLTGPRLVDAAFIEVATLLLVLSMFPLMVAICLDVYLIATLILHNGLLSGLLSCFFLLLFVSLWFVFPRLKGRATNHRRRSS
ncbi:MAG: hypothetical protein C5B55_06965 [Blastocatellia bacterium]|nr:MAG: hypothetical protein C5B55_06965 [Blastocatellia bacterium]